jgi:DNA adenine methylase
MKYMGSKARIAKHILPIILKDRKPGQWYVEPFVGGANMIDKVDGNRIGADSNYWLIDALKYIRDGSSIPKSNEEFTENDYRAAADHARGNSECYFADGLIGYALFAFSFGAKFIGGWSRGNLATGESRDYVREQYNAAIKQSPRLKGIELAHSTYQDLKIPDRSIIYCDPPYAGTTKYKDGFNHDDFWKWVREKTTDGNTVFVSEYKAPDDFKCVWEMELGVSVAKTGKHKRAVEKLFIYNQQ